MKLSSLVALLENRISSSEFRCSIASDVAEYLEKANTPGSVMPVRVTEDLEIALTIESIKGLCRLFINAQLKSEELAFIADALQLSDSVNFDEGISEFLASMTDPEINGPFTVDDAKKILSGA
ncbi:MAG: hypothetical protein AB7D06_07965 [Pedobacter sp.]